MRLFADRTVEAKAQRHQTVKLVTSVYQTCSAKQGPYHGKCHTWQKDKTEFK